LACGGQPAFVCWQPISRCCEKIEGYRKKRAHYAMFDGDCKGCITAGKKNLAGERDIPGQENLADTDKPEPHGPLYSPREGARQPGKNRRQTNLCCRPCSISFFPPAVWCAASLPATRRKFSCVVSVRRLSRESNRPFAGSAAENFTVSRIDSRCVATALPIHRLLPWRGRRFTMTVRSGSLSAYCSIRGIPL
jgi:hypothetical protein